MKGHICERSTNVGADLPLRPIFTVLSVSRSLALQIHQLTEAGNCSICRPKFVILEPPSHAYKLSFMDIPEARTLLHRLLPPCRPSCSFSHFRFLTRYFGHQTPLENVLKSTIHLGHHVSMTHFTIVPAKKGLSNPSSEELYEVVWIIEAELAEGQLLYISGDPDSLGCWEPAMAVLMSPTGQGNIWRAKVKIASGVNFKYNYFIRGPTWTLADIVWRPGPQFSLTTPLNVKEDGRILVRDSWMRFSMKSYPPHFLGSWIEETCIPVKPISVAIKDKDEIVEKHGSFLEESHQCLHDSLPKEEVFSDDEHMITAPNGVLQEEVFSDDEHMITAPNGVLLFLERDQPVEEPWLFQPFLFSAAGEDLKSDTSMKDDLGSDEITQSNKTNQHQYPVTKNFLPEEGRALVSEGDSVSTVILISSSLCTMQRIAVLEDNKLVELLLEPVKDHVQCDSVYLGVVTKLVPHMEGAFVNIGSSKYSLMEIKQYQEPFVFRPFERKAEKQVFNSVVGAGEGQATAHETKDGSHNVTEFEDLAENGSQEYDKENDGEQEFNVSEVLKGNTNNIIVDYGDAEADFEGLLDGEHYLEDENLNASPSEIEGFEYFPTSSQDLKVSGNTVSIKNKRDHFKKGTKVIVQVVKEGLGSKGPTLTPYPKLRSRFWVLLTSCDRIGVSTKISGVERTRLKIIAKNLQQTFKNHSKNFGLTVRTVAAGHSKEELQKDLEGLLSTWKKIVEHAKSAALAADEGVEGAIPVILHRAAGQTFSIVQDYFNEKVKKMVVDSPRTYHEVTSYLQDIAPDLCDRVELFDKKVLFDEFNINEEINNILSKWVSLPNGGSLVIEQTEALVSIDVNGGHGMFGHEASQEKAILDVNLAAAKQIAREIRLRDIGGIIVVDFIDMEDESNKRLVYEEVKKAAERDRSLVKVSELSSNGLMEIIRKRVRPSVTFMISEPCTCCHGTGRVEALEFTFSKIEQEFCRLLAKMEPKADVKHPKSWPKFTLRANHEMCGYLTKGKLAILSSSLKVWIYLKVTRGFNRGTFEVKPFTEGKVEDPPISMLRLLKSRIDS